MDKELDKFFDDLANNTPNSEQFDKEEKEDEKNIKRSKRKFIRSDRSV